ncbi:MAG: NAD(P)H-dependent oxidoreductase [Flavobacteriaceae bacterium CG_4_8_14_3_um_filter_34_10]|nr:NAD(P)H-dependent oxidoreductase [Flavobacteriia bacterium]OIP51816.1 MAG: NAD(P)H-dependent oxidoreductase [Flavobacteriaceae bacterium CG2_30_34_30]PIV49330.1 MAG: NAD(P)H-dependent oxidoreductase [Flavobacteriaceae bacterium CG02_land_8_20_14_3_00_34_13]PIX10381.1 MAG: NAD(P)H-dependent oxidoreductase [Flavobacteriaceae bacterium CG_4_8_14_3_um_filter_34_10]PJC05945.1 MAG: NAD(P)H-dependent oxidoreductase [Flavobacteriaceae bacterium CG_4_9_14_0_8_um_filter_34_30]
MNTYIENLNWRYATKKFDSTKTVSNEDLELLKDAIQLSASSYGLQPYKVLIIADKEIRERLQPAAWGQPQITEASHLIIFVNNTQFHNTHIDAYMQNVSKTRNLNIENLKGYADFMKSKITPLSSEAKENWTAKQTYIALGNLLSAAAFLKIDACPMEGFEANEINKILDLEKSGFNTTIIVPIGYRSKDDQTQHYPKVRTSKTELFITI